MISIVRYLSEISGDSKWVGRLKEKSLEYRKDSEKYKGVRGDETPRSEYTSAMADRALALSNRVSVSTHPNNQSSSSRLPIYKKDAKIASKKARNVLWWDGSHGKRVSL